MDINLLHGDCLELMKDIPDKSVDMILCDLPYGTTACKWDTVLPFEPLWEQYKRVIKPHGAIVLTATQPFSSSLVFSNIKGFKYEWIWQKEQGVGFQVAKYRPMQEHEHVLVFTANGERVNYYPIKERLEKTETVKRFGNNGSSDSSPLAYADNRVSVYKDRYPTSIKLFKRDKGYHPTQKPVALFEYLIKTYSNEGDIVLDNCMGSGTTGVACLNTNRNFIGIELDDKYFEIAKERIERHMRQISIFDLAKESK
ncbi:MAG: site-specific DNA-methyltransferase [Bacteroidales bacterium]|nr:site-specific DNA-methyltransferase [Bacteroidales bacterium]